MASNLVPTRIVNKNGVSTLVYKSVDNSGDSDKTVSAIPAPAAEPGVQEPVPTGDKAVDDVKLYLYYKVKHVSTSKRVQSRLMSTLDPNTPEVIAQTMGMERTAVFASAVEWCLQARSFELLNNLAVIPVPPGQTPDLDLMHLRAVHGLQRHRGNVSLISMSETELAPYRSLVHAAMAVRGRDVVVTSGSGKVGTSQHLNNPELEQFIWLNHERVDEVIKMVNAGDRPFDPELYQTILDNPSRALSEGTL